MSLEIYALCLFEYESTCIFLCLFMHVWILCVFIYMNPHKVISLDKKNECRKKKFHLAWS